MYARQECVSRPGQQAYMIAHMSVVPMPCAYQFKAFGRLSVL